MVVLASCLLLCVCVCMCVYIEGWGGVGWRVAEMLMAVATDERRDNRGDEAFCACVFRLTHGRIPAAEGGRAHLKLAGPEVVVALPWRPTRTRGEARPGGERKGVSRSCVLVAGHV